MESSSCIDHQLMGMESAFKCGNKTLLETTLFSLWMQISILERFLFRVGRFCLITTLSNRTLSWNYASLLNVVIVSVGIHVHQSCNIGNTFIFGVMQPLCHLKSSWYSFYMSTWEMCLINIPHVGLNDPKSPIVYTLFSLGSLWLFL